MAFNWDILAQKYAIMQQQANAATQLAGANSNLANTQAQLMPGEAAARNFATAAGGNMSNAQAQLFGANAAQVPGQAASEEQQRGAESGLLSAQTQGALGRNFLSDDASRAIQDRLHAGGWNVGGGVNMGFAKGTSGVPGYADGTDGVGKVPGKGDGTVDTQRTILAPGEAVLNKGAAEHLGRDTIALLNAVGLHKMGMSGPGAPPSPEPQTSVSSPTSGDQTIPGYAQGDEYVGSAVAPSVPGPGQTITSGTWGTPIGNSGNTGIRQSLGLGMPRPVGNVTPAPKPGGLRGLLGFAGGTSDVPDAGDSYKGTPLRGYYEDEYGKAALKLADETPGMGIGASPNQGQLDKAAKMRSPEGYAKGTAKVPDKKPPPGKPPGGEKGAQQKGAGLKGDGGGPGGSSLSPEIIHAIMQMGQGMGGMPQPNAAGPMPMPMPQAAPRGR